ncbi:MAG: nucleotidyltransferase family protein [Proteobacteria bacterium]|nr:nucleotidyltransferase family protein [Pseudomonadota bacterium]
MTAPSQTGTGDGLYCMVLAAGASTRFGSPKQLVRVNGRPLLHAAATRAAEVTGSAVIVVLGSGADQISSLLRHTTGTVVINRDWREGIASSIRVGMSHLPPACEAVLLMLADQAAVTADDLKRLAGAWRRQTQYLVAASYEGTVGVPAIFPRGHFPELARLRGDAGARGLLRGHTERLVRVPMPSAAVDIDTPEDLLKIPEEPAR